MLLNMNRDKLNEKINKAQEGAKLNKRDYKEKCDQWMDKFKQIDDRIKKRDKNIDIFTKKHKQINELRF